VPPGLTVELCRTSLVRAGATQLFLLIRAEISTGCRGAIGTTCCYVVQDDSRHCGGGGGAPPTISATGLTDNDRAAPSDAAGLQRWAALPEAPDLLPGEDRNFGTGLFVDLVPSTCWFTNVRGGLVRQIA
jgi:hypothetical protein